MDFITDLLLPGNDSIAATLVLYSFVIAAGIFIGKLKICGVSLGVTFVLFVGILMGHFGYIVDEHILKFVREFGLILFCLLYTSPSPRDPKTSRMPSSA